MVVPIALSAVAAVSLRHVVLECRILPRGCRDARMTKNKNENTTDTLAELIRRALESTGWSVERAAQEAEHLGLSGLSQRNIRDYLNNQRKRPPSDSIIRRFARLFRENEEGWLGQFPQSGLDPLLLRREAVMANQERLSKGDEVTLISSRAFLEADDGNLMRGVLRTLNRGVTYKYYFPAADNSQHPFRADAYDSYQRFRETHVARHSFDNPPSIFGYAVDPARFKYFSPLHTIVHYDSNVPGVSRTYVYIEATRGNAGQVSQVWYAVPDSTWQQIEVNLREARSPVADANMPMLPLNPFLRGVRGEYIDWFLAEDSPTRYGALRPILGHSADRCVEAIKREISGIARSEVSSLGELLYLDVGCGDGYITRLIAEHLVQRSLGVKAVGLDVSASQLQKATDLSKNSSKKIHFDWRTGTFETFHWEGPQFRVITAIHSMYTIDEAYVRRLYELLAPGGIACIWMAMRDNNIVTSICDAVDAVLRPGQRRNAAEDVEAYARGAGLSPNLRLQRAAIPSLISADGRPSPDGEILIDFCALQPARNNERVLAAALKVLVPAPPLDSRDHPLTDGLIVIEKKDLRISTGLG